MFLIPNANTFETMTASRTGQIAIVVAVLGLNSEVFPVVDKFNLSWRTHYANLQ